MYNVCSCKCKDNSRFFTADTNNNNKANYPIKQSVPIEANEQQMHSIY